MFLHQPFCFANGIMEVQRRAVDAPRPFV